MAINFSVGDKIIPNHAYLETLKQQTPTATLKQSLEILVSLLGQPCEVLKTGRITLPIRSYINVKPTDIHHPQYNLGLGVVIYFASDDDLNNSFEASEAYLRDMQTITILNNSGSTILKNRVLRQTGFDGTTQLVTATLADATTEANAVVLGVAQEDIANGSQGAVLIDGSFQLDTTAFTLGSIAWLSDTPGIIATLAGTIDVAVGRVLSVGPEGTISFFSALTGGGGSGSGFFSFGSGLNAGVGQGTTPPIATGENSLAQGDGCYAKGPNSLTQGKDCYAWDAGFAQGYNQYANSYSFSQGYGVDPYKGAYGWSSFAQGYGVLVYKPYSFAQGGNYINVQSSFTLAQGSGIYIPGAFNGRCLVQGKDITLPNNHGWSLVQGADIAPTGSCNHSLIQGYKITTSNPRHALIQGQDHDLSAYRASTCVLVQGRNHTLGLYGDSSIVTGLSNTLYDFSGQSIVNGTINYLTGRNSFISGRRNTVTRTSPSNSVGESFAQGYFNSITGNRSFAQGRDNTITGSYSFVQGKDNTVSGNNGFAQGIGLETGYTCFSQGYGYSSFRGATGYASFAQGAGVNVEGNYCFGQGAWYIDVRGDRGVFAQGQTIYQQGTGNSTRWNLLQGGTINTTSNTFKNNLVQGNDINFGSYDSSFSLVQGNNHTLGCNMIGCMIQGQGHNFTNVTGGMLYNLILGSNHNFNATNITYSAVIGSGHRLLSAGSYHYALALLGHNHTVNSGTQHSFAHGSGNTLAGNRLFAQGTNNTINTDTSFAQGISNTISLNYPYNVAIGGNNSITGTGWIIGSFAWGYNNTLQYGNQIALGHDITFAAYGGNTAALGANHDMNAWDSFTAGYRNKVHGNGSSVIGQASAAYANYCHVVGSNAKATRDRQFVRGGKGSAGAFSGSAQSSNLVKQATITANAAWTTILTVDLEDDRAYSIEINLVARNTTTGTENASFKLSTAIAYRNGGGAVLQGSPVALSSTNTGGGSAAWNAQLIQSGNDVLLQVQSDAADTVQWCVDFGFVEVAG